ncbi:unnamed protein product [Brachionus calyciflorus]|uniref:Uncharacterized protein n=1 Tax=Brachionus calyciflorus TaxID=104777 RepID=A0A813R6K2_9BILA|nr:unnamed protein product [Brachionus calyciflorus]
MKIIGFVLLIFFNYFHKAKFATLDEKYWQISCNLNGCAQPLNTCLNCIGEQDCIKCISNSKPECSTCANEIFNKDDLEEINENKYLLCESSDIIHNKVCLIYCRGNFFRNGQCLRFQNFPVCQCSTNSS